MHKKSVNLRYGEVSQQKNTRATYTPANLASFVAQQILQTYTLPASGNLGVLEPAVGDGELLHALLFGWVLNRLPTKYLCAQIGTHCQAASLNYCNP